MCKYQSEQTLENELIKQLSNNGYEKVKIENEEQLLSNLKSQLEKHNKLKFSDDEFKKILNQLKKENTSFGKAHTLREKLHYVNDNGDNKYIELINQKNWCQNTFQVTNQITIIGKRENRYDVTILINGLPLTQIELKRRGLELKEAFNQTRRYKQDSYAFNSELFDYIQVFVISNGVDTKYYANNHVDKMSFEQTFFWTDEKNKKITNLKEFADSFLEKCHLSKMITKNIVLLEHKKMVLILRPYQCYAVENIKRTIEYNASNGYVWHTTGSGKTLTSFKAAQEISRMDDVHKVVFVVDRKDLDSQTTIEFNTFKEGSVDGTDNTRKLVKQLNNDTKMIVTTIQKLNTAITKEHHRSVLEKLRDEKVVFIFDECHRSQFGSTHDKIKNFFTNNQMIGFTGTPIFKENASTKDGIKRTTKDLFGECLHKYIITNAISDNNVLRFSIEYVGKYKQNENSKNLIDIETETGKLNMSEILESDDRLNKISDYILSVHNKKTHNQNFNAIFCVSNIKTLIKYYDIFRFKDHNLKIATIFSYGQNDDMIQDSSLEIDESEMDITSVNIQSRDKLDSYIKDYNKMFSTNYSTDSNEFYNYYDDISRRVKNNEVDILIVVNMFLTGFDSKMLNTLYVDKNLQHHGLIQAFSRTNRIFDQQKTQGNIVCFRNLKDDTDKAITLFADENPIEDVILKPYTDYVKDFNLAYEKLMEKAPDLESIDNMISEKAKSEFVKLFREVMRVKNKLNSFADFEHSDIEMNEQEFQDYVSKYRRIYQESMNGQDNEKTSLLNEIDFEIELIRVDKINVDYILELISKIKDDDGEDKEAKKKTILNSLNENEKLYKKKDLIEKFINKIMDNLHPNASIKGEFDKFMEEEQIKEFQQLCQEFDLNIDKAEELVNEYIFSRKQIMPQEVIEITTRKLGILEKKKFGSIVFQKIVEFVERFFD